MNTAGNPIVRVWSCNSFGTWLLERSYPLKYCRDGFGLGEAGETIRGEDGRNYAWFPQGVDPNQTEPNRRTCPDCNITIVNACHIVHEAGCPSSHLHQVAECDWCGSEFQAEKDRRFCDEDCAESYWG